MADFHTSSVNKTAKRVYTNPIDTLANFLAAVNAFKSDTSMALTSKTEKKRVLKLPIAYFDELGETKSTILLTTDNDTSYNDGSGVITADTALTEDLAGAEGSVSAKPEDASWYVQFSCELNGDTFNLSFSRKQMVISNYTNDETLAAVETWADGQDKLN